MTMQTPPPSSTTAPGNEPATAPAIPPAIGGHDGPQAAHVPDSLSPATPVPDTDQGDTLTGRATAAHDDENEHEADHDDEDGGGDYEDDSDDEDDEDSDDEGESLYEIEGPIAQLLYSPKGHYEGLLIELGEDIVQVVVGKDWQAELAEANEGEHFHAILVPYSSDKGEGEHAVFKLVDWLESEDEDSDEMTVSGRVIGFNFARHGVPNGYLLDTGDFIHTRPEGFEELDLEVGDEIEATGPATPLADGLGWVVDVS